LANNPRTVNNLLPCGWSQEGLRTFNEFAKEISKDRKKHGEEFEKEFKVRIEQQIENSTTNKNGKRKRNCIDTYNDLNEGQFIITTEEDSDKEKDDWVVKNGYEV
jgi:hypothetical protein